jgi:putative transposase
MTNKTKILPRRKPTRLKDYDYSENGGYFVTICSKDKKNIFAERIDINVGEGLAPSRNKYNIQLSSLGYIIDKQWNDMVNHYECLELDQYIIMPNHIHGIVIINDQRTGASPVPTLQSIIGAFKSRCSIEFLRYIKKNNLNVSAKIWQRSFYDHVIRNYESLSRIREYIINNPQTWDTDENNLKNEHVQTS